ncbi:hypothetical protein LEP1GSC013_4624 [Leptospira interrogans serovar Valbuzzi str. Duyster]|uniref:hypothetical protein n=1 Tax=Leptospira interrogans TaxID=173 RepID=UPI0002BFADBD|nr:hypothetical protein LEP1GSC013_4624 [Leptospira interrogans serovar Valbuzzi str. Duyster]
MKPLFCGHHQNLNSILKCVRRKKIRKNFLKVWVPTILKLVLKIVIYSSSHILGIDL